MILHPPSAFGANLTPAASNWQPAPFELCTGTRCEFQLTGENERLTLTDRGTLTRLSGNERLFENNLVEQGERVLFAGLTAARNELVVALARERMSISAMSAMRGGLPDPRSVDRAYRVELINPKSGELIKQFDLGAFLPVSLSSSDHGELIIIAGRHLQTRVEEIRVYNARSGKLENTLEANDIQTVTLGSNGLVVDGRPFAVAAPGGGAPTRRVSRDPYSIAEFEVHCSPLPAALWASTRNMAVVGFEAVSEDVNDMLSGALGTRLSTAGLALVERRRIEAILQELALQASGLTAIDHAAEIGELGNASDLVFGSVSVQGTRTTISVRSVSVESGSIETSCEVACRDCRQDDLLEAIGYLAEAWVSARPN